MERGERGEATGELGGGGVRRDVMDVEGEEVFGDHGSADDADGDGDDDEKLGGYFTRGVSRHAHT